ncbi:hypothetical protein ACFO4O_03105 [Glaciecola siphonariae]|uniref:Outer membrane protein beta-barrel domain-containing protein n=1 Tax=Glaciecola siphonariae TaxID=521012 RepID=A0ABV9LRL2_9ALTE
MTSHTSPVLTLCISLMLVLFCSPSKADDTRLHIESGILLSYTSIEKTQLSGASQEQLFIYSDQFSSHDHDSSEDFVSGVYFSAGRHWHEWLLQGYYEYRYRFDINGHLGDTIRVAHLRTNINTQRLMLSIGRSLYQADKWQWGVSLAAGISLHDIDLRTFDRNEDYTLNYSDRSFTWHIKTDIQYHWSDTFTWSLALQRADLGKLTFGPQFDGIALDINKYTGIDLTLGLVYQF